MTELWRTVSGHDDYEVSSLGQVRSLIEVGRWRRVRPTPFILKAFKRPNGYLAVVLSNRKLQYVHRLVCIAFHGDAPHGKECAHLNGIRSDNREVNLAWVTRKENLSHCVEHGTRKWGEAHSNSKLTFGAVSRIRSGPVTSGQIKRFADEFGVSPSTINDVVNCKTWNDPRQ